MRYVFFGTVDSVEQRRHVGRVVKTASDDVVEQNVTFSWVVVVGRVAFDFGEDEPELAKGDRIRWTLEKA